MQVAGSYEEDEDRAEEEINLLSVSSDIPPIFHKSLEELNDIESVHEEIDFISSRQTVTFDHRNGFSKPDENRPYSDQTPTTVRRESLHKRPLSLSNITMPKSTTSGPISPVKHVDFVKDNMLLRKVQQQEYKRANSDNTSSVDDGGFGKRGSMTHRRTQSSIPFGSSGKLRPFTNLNFVLSDLV